MNLAEPMLDRPSPLILVVEDEPLVRLVGADFLIDAGYRVLEAGNAEEALRLLESRDDIEVVFTDVEMPGLLNGLDLAGHIHERWPCISVLITSGRRHCEAKCQRPDDGFLAKPYAPGHLVAQVEAMLHRH